MILLLLKVSDLQVHREKHLAEGQWTRGKAMSANWLSWRYFCCAIKIQESLHPRHPETLSIMVLTLPNHCGENQFPRPCWEGPWLGAPNSSFQAAQTFSNTHTQLWTSMLWWHVLTTRQIQHVVITLAVGCNFIQNLRFDPQTKLSTKQKSSKRFWWSRRDPI